MLKVIWLLKRLHGITPEQFHYRYERHARLAQQHIGHLMRHYKRNYVTETRTNGNARGVGSAYDCIAEWGLPDAAALTEINRILAEPAVSKLFAEDMADFLDRRAAVRFLCHEVDTGTDYKRQPSV